MLKNILQALGGEPAPLTPADERLALAALMVRVARADHDYDRGEIAKIDQLLMAEYGLSAPQAQALRTEAETLEEQAPDTVRFTKVIKAHVPFDERERIIAALWSVALADGDRADEENSLLRMVTKLLGINDRDSALIRQRVNTS